LPGVGTNRYAYAGNDPVNKSDPNGHTFASAVHDFFGGIGKAVGDALGGLGRGISNSINSVAGLFGGGNDSGKSNKVSFSLPGFRATYVIDGRNVRPNGPRTPVEEFYANQIIRLQENIRTLNPRETFLEPSGGSISPQARDLLQSRLDSLRNELMRDTLAPTGRRGYPNDNPAYQPNRNTRAEIFGRTFSGHALDQMQNRGITPSVVRDMIQNGRPSNSYDNRTVFTNNNGYAIVGSDGAVVTVVGY
jgi:hypothetical protein